MPAINVAYFSVQPVNKTTNQPTTTFLYSTNCAGSVDVNPVILGGQRVIYDDYENASVGGNIENFTPVGYDLTINISELSYTYLHNLIGGTQGTGSDALTWRSHFPGVTNLTYALNVKFYTQDYEGSDFRYVTFEFPVCLMKPPEFNVDSEEFASTPIEMYAIDDYIGNLGGLKIGRAYTLPSS